MLPKCDILMKMTPKNVKMTPRTAQMLPKCDDLTKIMTPEKVKIPPRNTKISSPLDIIFMMPEGSWPPAPCGTMPA